MAISTSPSSTASNSSRYSHRINGSTMQVGLRPKQSLIRELSQSIRIKILAAVGATGTGKTWYGPIWAWERARREPNTDVLIVGRGFKSHIEATVIPYVEDWLRTSQTPFRTVHDKYITYLPNGSRFIYRSDEAPEGMESIHPTGGAWVDEAGLMSGKTWAMVKARCSLYDAPIFVTSIPYRAGFLKEEIYEASLKGDPRVAYVHLTWRDSPEFTEERIKRIKATMPAHEFERRYEGNWAKPFGMIYPLPDDSELLVDGFNVPLGWPMRELVPGFEIPQGWPLYAGLDWGFTAPTAITWAVLDPDDVLTVMAVYEQSDRTPEDHVAALKPLGLCDVDSESFGSEKLNDVNYGIEVVTDRLQTSRLKILQGCNDWLDRREGYLWALDPKSGGETLLSKPAPGIAEHLMDSTRYLCVGVKDHRMNRAEIVAPIVRRQRVG